MTITTRPAVSALAERPHAQVLIIGGGINGIATFRDLALQGVDVALVERGDFSSGASAASSHMIHGGIRYLENGEFRLVRESVKERNRLLRLAPHLVRPLKTTVPIYSTFAGLASAPFRFIRHGKGRKTERGAVLIKIGLLLYDSFSRGGGMVRRHQFHGRKRSLIELPDLSPRVKYTASYWDASMPMPERLALDVLRDGLAHAGARAASYVEAFGAADGAVRLRDLETGVEFAFAADVVVNATGPWTDLTNEVLGVPTRFMGGTRGSHIVLDNPALHAATGGREIFFEHSDGRIVLIYPLHGRVMVGTSDLEHDIREPARCTEDEVDYFLDLIGGVFPAVPVSREQIVYRFSGVRPLPRHDDMSPGFVSRDYRIVQGSLPGADATVLSLVGGKWTTFRALGEHLADDVLAELGRARTASTRDLPIGAGAGFPRTAQERKTWLDAQTGISRERANVLLDRYGTRAAEFIAVIGDRDEPLASLPDYGMAELAHLAATELVVHLADVVIRRTPIAFAGRAKDDVLREVAAAIAPALDWDAARIIAEVESVQAQLRVS